MKLTHEMIAQMEAPITKYERSDSTEKRCVAAAFRLLIADLEDAQKELENERARGIHSCHDNCTQDGCVNRRLREELNTTRKQLAEAQALNAQLLSVAEKMRCAGGAQEFQHWFDELKLFLLSKPDTSAIDAAIVEAINDEKRNPWKRAIIEGLIVSHILNATHEADPVRALADLIDWECKETLDPAVSEEARVLIEKYRKDAERLDYLQAFARCDPKMDGEHVWWSIHPRPTLRGNTLRAAIDAAIAAKGETE